MISNTEKHLVFLACETIRRNNGNLYLSAKSIEGLELYAKLWPGRVTLIIQSDEKKQAGINDKVINTVESSFEIVVGNFNTPEIESIYLNASVVLYVVSDLKQFNISKKCKEAGTPCVGITEYTFKTYLQMINSKTKNPFLRLRRYIWQWNNEKKTIKSIKNATAIQANGTPTFEAYKSIKDNILLYFDNRSQLKSMIDKNNLEARLEKLKQNQTLNIAFSGRLTEIKGCNDLIAIASILKQNEINFTLRIFGNGNLYNAMENQIIKLGLQKHVFMEGAVDFETVLVPTIKKEVDLYLICHKQGDPSCTYLETFACGIPIIGYLNEAFSGILKQSDVGWGERINDVKAIANKIIELDKNRDEIAMKSYQAMEFSKKHNFEAVFENRINHLISVAK